MEEPSDPALWFGTLVLSGDHTVRMGCIAIKKPPQISRTDAPGVVADEALRTLKPVVFRHAAHTLLRPNPARVHPIQRFLNAESSGLFAKRMCQTQEIHRYPHHRTSSEWAAAPTLGNPPTESVTPGTDPDGGDGPSSVQEMATQRGFNRDPSGYDRRRWG